VHFSLWEGDRNRFYDDGLSQLALAFIAGVLDLPGLSHGTADFEFEGHFEKY
jgi:glutamine synthetase